MSNNDYRQGYKIGLAEGVFYVLYCQNPGMELDKLRDLYREFLNMVFDQEDDVDYFLNMFDYRQP